MAVYNRYVPQADGSFRKTTVQEPLDCDGSSIPYEPPMIPCQHLDEGKSGGCGRCCSSGLGLGSFFRNLFPQGLDVEDLIVVLLLLLLSQDGGKNGNRALLTLGAYLFL